LASEDDPLLAKTFNIAFGRLVHRVYRHLFSHRTVVAVVGSRRAIDVYIIAYGEGLILYRLVVLDIRLIELLNYIQPAIYSIYNR